MSVFGHLASAVLRFGSALLAQIPDNAVAGGNARGANAVDLQTSRVAATQVASANWSTISGGQSNSATQLRATVGGGANNTASGQVSTVAGGSANTAGGLCSWCPGGASATTRGIFGRGAWAAGQIAALGDAQCGEHPLLCQATDATPTRLTADGAVASTTNQIILPNFGRYAGTLTVVAGAVGGNASATWRLPVSAYRGNGPSTVVVYEGSGGSFVPTASLGTGSAWRLDIVADTVNGGIAVTVTGAAATTINHSARFANVEATTAS